MASFDPNGSSMDSRKTTKRRRKHTINCSQANTNNKDKGIKEKVSKRLRIIKIKSRSSRESPAKRMKTVSTIKPRD